MFMVFKKRNLIIAVLVVTFLISLAICRLFEFEKPASVETSQNHNIPIGSTVLVSGENIRQSEFDNIKSKKAKDREQAIKILNDIINNSAASEKSRTEAADKVNKIADVSVKESDAESIIISKGYKDAIVYITDNAINVTVKADKLNQNDISKIRDVVSEQTNNANNNIKIVAVD